MSLDHRKVHLVLFAVVSLLLSSCGDSPSSSASSSSSSRGSYDKWQVSATPDGFLTFDTNTGEIRRYVHLSGSKGKVTARLVFDSSLFYVQDMDTDNRDVRESIRPELKEERKKREAEQVANELMEAKKKAAKAPGKIDLEVLKAKFRPGDDYQNALTFIGTYRGNLGDLLWCTDVDPYSDPVVDAYRAAIPSGNYRLVANQARTAILQTFGGVLQAVGALTPGNVEPGLLTSPPFDAFNAADVRAVIEGSRDVHDNDPVVQQQKVLKLLFQKIARGDWNSEGGRLLSKTLPKEVLQELR